MQLYCKKCGAEVGQDDMFCTSCNTRLNKPDSVISRVGISEMASGKSEFSADAAVTETDLTGFDVMGFRLTQKLFSLMGSDYYSCVNEEGGVPVMMRHMTFPNRVDCDCAALNNGNDINTAKLRLKDCVAAIGKEIVMFASHCATTGVDSLNYRCETFYSELYDTYHIFVLMNYAVPLPIYYREKEIDMRNILEIGVNISDKLCRMEKYRSPYDAFSDTMIFIGENNKVYLDCHIPAIYESFLPSSSLNSYHRQFVSPQGKNYETYSLGMVLYKLLSGYKNPYINHFNAKVSAKDYILAENSRLMMAEPIPLVNMQNTVGLVINEAITRSERELTLSEFNRILCNSFNYISANELNIKIN